MPLIHLRPFQGSVGSRAHSVPHAIFALAPSELLCPESPFIVTADTPVLLLPDLRLTIDNCLLPLPPRRPRSFQFSIDKKRVPGYSASWVNCVPDSDNASHLGWRFCILEPAFRPKSSIRNTYEISRILHGFGTSNFFRCNTYAASHKWCIERTYKRTCKS